MMARISKEPEVRRQEILDTAMQLFYEKGYEKTSITDIAKNMGVAQGLCYRYFTSKEEIFDTALDQYAQKLVERLTDGILEKPGPLRQIIIEMPTFLDVEWEDSFYYKVCHGSENLKTHRQLSMRVCEKLMPIIEKVLQRAALDGEIHIADCRVTASFCVYGQLGILLDQTLDGALRVQRIKAFLLKMLGLDA